MFATIAGSYPREPLPGLPDRVADADRRLGAGKIEPPDHDAVMAEVVREVLLEQEHAGLAIVADGWVAHADRLVPLIQGLGGEVGGGHVTLPDGDAGRVPLFRDRVAWQAPITLPSWTRADRSTDLLVKQVLIGPYTMSTLAEPASRARQTLALALAEALNAELRTLAAAGCPIIQVDEGALVAIGDDEAEWQRYADVQRRLTAGLEGHHLSLGLYPGPVHPTGHATILDGTFRSYLVDVLAGPDAWRLVSAAPADRGIVCGVVDASAGALDETEVMVWAMSWAAGGGRGPERVGAAPNGSLRAVGRHKARRKLERLGEAIRVGSMGPLAEVAEALDPKPRESRMAELRRMAEAVDAATGAR